MAIENFVPEIWASDLLLDLQKQLVYGSCTNRNYEGEIRQKGDTLKITGITDVTIKSYTPHTDITVEAATDKEGPVLTIDQADYFAFEVDDVEATQAAGDVKGPLTGNAGYKMADKVDQYIAGLMDKGATTSVKDITAVTTPSDAYDALVLLGVALTKKNVPKTGRWVVVSPDFYGMLQGDTRFIAGTDRATDTLYNGVIGLAGGFTVLESNNVPTSGSKQSIIAGTNQAVTFAQQINKIEAARMEKRFADMVKGLDLYGGVVVRPECLAKATLTVGG